MAYTAQVTSERVRHSHKLSRIEIDAIRHRWLLGESRHELADCFDVSEHTIRYHCHDLARQSIQRRIDVDEVAALMAEGYRISQIAQRLDFDRCSIQRALARAA